MWRRKWQPDSKPSSIIAESGQGDKRDTIQVTVDESEKTFYTVTGKHEKQGE